MATQNPIEMDGTYPLPEAQLDRFMAGSMGYPERRTRWRCGCSSGSAGAGSTTCGR